MTKFCAVLVILVIAIALTQAQPEVSTTTATTGGVTTSTTTGTTTTGGPTVTSSTTMFTRPFCRSVGTCPPRSPPICARNPRGLCRRFGNVCQLQAKNCATAAPIQSWRRTSEAQCKSIRPGETLARCANECPRTPRICAPPPKTGQRVCLRSKNRKQCRIVASKCQQHNLNCHSKPRGNWTPVNASHCHKMKVGEKAKRCINRIVATIHQ